MSLQRTFYVCHSLSSLYHLDLDLHFRNSKCDNKLESGILEIFPSWYILSLNPNGEGVCSNLINDNSVSNLISQRNFYHKIMFPLVAL